MTTILNRDDKRGHFHLQLDEGREVTGSDLGTALHLWTQGARLTPSAARVLADALNWWANRRDAIDREIAANRAESRPELTEAHGEPFATQPDLFGDLSVELEVPRG